MKPFNNKKNVARLFVFTPMAFYAGIAMGTDHPPATASEANVDTSNWKCKYCEFEEGFSGEVEVGALYVSDDSFKFGEYNGLFEKGAYFIGNATALYRDEDAYFMDLFVRDLGLEKRSIGIEGGKQGKYKLFLRYDEIPHYISDSAVTPYLGTGSNTLSLPGYDEIPPGWQRAPTTSGMTTSFSLRFPVWSVDSPFSGRRTGGSIPRFIMPRSSQAAIGTENGRWMSGR